MGAVLVCVLLITRLYVHALSQFCALRRMKVTEMIAF